MVIGIIEDDNLLRKALDTSMKNQGYTTILAASRKEAIKNIDSSVDLLIVDIGLPDGDGINLYQELQKDVYKRQDQGLFVDIQVDGGIYQTNVKEVLDAGANIIVAGSAVFKGDPAENTKAMMEILKTYE